jgi:purine-binding chemotaxis protein CheW
MTGTGAERWERLARAAATAREGREEPLAQRELLRVEVAGSPYALPIERVREIVRLRAITAVPRVPALVLGVISLRGEIVQVLDLRQALGAEAEPPGRRARIVVLHGESGEVAGLLVDAVSEVLRVPESELRDAPGEPVPCVSAICTRGDRFVSLLDPDQVFELAAS